MIKTLLAIAVAGALGLPMAAASAGSDNSVASPATGASSLRERFDQLDRNRDGFISRAEAKDASELNTRFAELDQNNDGKLSREEYNALGRGARGATGAGTASAPPTSK